jgi:hypothetical protein
VTRQQKIILGILAVLDLLVICGLGAVVVNGMTGGGRAASNAPTTTARPEFHGTPLTAADIYLRDMKALTDAYLEHITTVALILENWDGSEVSNERFQQHYTELRRIAEEIRDLPAVEPYAICHPDLLIAINDFESGLDAIDPTFKTMTSKQMAEIMDIWETAGLAHSRYQDCIVNEVFNLELDPTATRAANAFPPTWTPTPRATLTPRATATPEPYLTTAEQRYLETTYDLSNQHLARNGELIAALDDADITNDDLAQMAAEVAAIGDEIRALNPPPAFSHCHLHLINHVDAKEAGNDGMLDTLILDTDALFDDIDALWGLATEAYGNHVMCIDDVLDQRGFPTP